MNEKAGMDQTDVQTNSADHAVSTAPAMTYSGVFKRAEPLDKTTGNGDR
jgi:hypothetical protein